MTTAYPLTWPDGLPRTNPRRASQFKQTLTAALKNVRGSLALFGKDTGKPVEAIVISSNNTLGVDNPADSGVAVWFSWDGQQACIAVDRYLKLFENLQAIHHIIEARRVEYRHGGLHIVRQTFKGFIALPAPAESDWREVLGFRPGIAITAAQVKEAHRAAAQSLHPDRGGTDEGMARLNAARDVALAEIGG